MTQHDPALARSIAAGIETMSDSDLARYLQLISTIAAYARFYRQAREARHAGCNNAAREFETYARDALERYAQSVQTVHTTATEVIQ